MEMKIKYEFNLGNALDLYISYVNPISNKKHSFAKSLSSIVGSKTSYRYDVLSKAREKFGDDLDGVVGEIRVIVEKEIKKYMLDNEETIELEDYVDELLKMLNEPISGEFIWSR